PSVAIFASGFKAAGSFNHAATVSTVTGRIPAASVRRLPNVVRSGPSVPLETPRIVWQPTQALRAKMALPSAAGPAAGPAGLRLRRRAPPPEGAGGSAGPGQPRLG